MRRPRRLYIVLLPVGLILAVGLFATTQAARGAVPTWARDLDCDGHLSVGEWFEAGLDYGWRSVAGNAQGCSQVFRLKDGLPGTTWCGTPPRCQSALARHL